MNYRCERCGSSNGPQHNGNCIMCGGRVRGETLVIDMTGVPGTWPHEVYRLYLEANIEGAITERWPELRPGDWIRVTVERIEPVADATGHVVRLEPKALA